MPGALVAAEFVNKGVAYRAFLWRGADGSEAYYTQDGKSLRKAFLRSPVEFTRITSGFSLARFHPFLQTWRAHKGVDFAAPIGTPVRAAGDGKVIVAGRQNGYGNVVILQHGGAILDRVRASVAIRRGNEARRARRAGRRSSATSVRPAGRPARICTTSSASTTCSATR